MPGKIKTINIALQGGGAHGALTWGVLDRLLEDGRVKFDGVSATSAGAMNAAVLAHGLATGGNDGARESLQHFWKSVSEQAQKFSPIKLSPWEEAFGVKVENTMSYYFFDLMSRSMSPYQLNPVNFNPLREIIEDHVDFDRIHSSKVLKLFISATNVKTGKIRIFENRDVSVDAVMASACLPFIFQAVKVDEDYYWDGGYLGNPAIYPLIYNSKFPDVLIVHINPINRDEVPESAADIVNRMNEISFNSSLMREMRAIAFVTRLLDQGWIKEEYKEKLRRMYMHSIRSDITMQKFSVASKFDCRWNFFQQLFTIGRETADQWLKENYDSIGKHSTIDLNEYL